MRNIFSIYKRELKSYFFSPIGYIVILAMVLIIGLMSFLPSANQHIQYAQNFNQISQQYQIFGQQAPPPNILTQIWQGIIGMMFTMVLFITPLVTMRLFTEERRTGTFELLATSPISSWAIVLGKFFAAFSLYLFSILITFSFASVILFWGNPDFGPVLSGYLGVILMGGLAMAVGTWISTLTENQVIAAVLTFFVMLMLLFMGYLTNFIPIEWLRVTLEYISFEAHISDFFQGVIDTKHIVYFISLTFFVLLMTQQSIESKRWRA